ncbi:MAG: phosphonate ABC transporter ATP-binding protein [Rhodospirillaceae bacterium]|jgi:phosphonate transport system ATP-binding protein|nr:phosphonate ABC transporter ATP-binding protein [Rhodospirillaceae bacterium]MBT7758716.1 phosphonate ABC transporter ATP-binding protein [Rhodospirillaceae bacterium]
MTKNVIRVEKLSKTFGDNRALDNLDLEIAEGEMVALIGASGSGKSTLLRHISGLAVGDRNSGTVEAMGGLIQKAGRIDGAARARRADIGFVFQQFNLVDRLSVINNVLLGNLGRINYWRGAFGRFSRLEKQRALEALHRVGIADKALQRAGTLSGGQKQRAAIARALVQEAKIILADEPIASLDPASSKHVMENLARINREDGTTVLVSLHQVDYALRFCPRIVALRAGRVVFDGTREQITQQLLKKLYGAESEDLILPPFATAMPEPSRIPVKSPPPDLQPAMTAVAS